MFVQLWGAMRTGLWLDFVNPQPLAARLLRPDPPLRYSSQASQVGLTPSKASHPIFGVSEACAGDPSPGALLLDPPPSSWDGAPCLSPTPCPDNNRHQNHHAKLQASCTSSCSYHPSQVLWSPSAGYALGSQWVWGGVQTV